MYLNKIKYTDTQFDIKELRNMTYGDDDVTDEVLFITFVYLKQLPK